MDLDLGDDFSEDDVVWSEVFVDFNAIDVGGSDVFLSQDSSEWPVEQNVANANDRALGKALVDDFNASRHDIPDYRKNCFVAR